MRWSSWAKVSMFKSSSVRTAQRPPARTGRRALRCLKFKPWGLFRRKRVRAGGRVLTVGSGGGGAGRGVGAGERVGLSRLDASGFFLFLLLLLRQPRLRMIYVSSTPVDPRIIEYYLALLPGVIPSHAQARLTMVSVGDASPGRSA